MSWFSTLKFHDRASGLTAGALDELDEYLSRPLSDEERNGLAPLVGNDGWHELEAGLMPVIRVPAEYKELLRHANGGLLANGRREFGFFGMKELREYYLNYLFPMYMPGALPIGLNGGGVFYAYDLRSLENTPVVACQAGVLSWEDAVFLGQSLAEVFSKDTDIGDEL